MNDGFPVRCVGLIDDSLIAMSVERINKIKLERRIKIFSSVAASIMLISTFSIVIPYYYSNFSVVDSPHIELPTIVIDSSMYQEISEEHYKQYGITSTPTSEMIRDYLGTYIDSDGVAVDVYSTSITPLKSILIADDNDRLYYIVFCNKTNDIPFSDAHDFFEYFGYSKSQDIVSMTVDGKKVDDINLIESFWQVISSSEICSIDEFAYAVHGDEWSEEKAQENYQSLRTIELNYGTASYLKITYSGLTGFFDSHACYFDTNLSNDTISASKQ